MQHPSFLRTGVCQDGGPSPFDGAVLLVTARGAFVARCSPADGGRLRVLHNIPRPPAAREGSFPAAAWRAQAAQPQQQEAPVQAPVPRAQLALAWEREALLLDVPLAQLPETPQQTGAGAPRRHTYVVCTSVVVGIRQAPTALLLGSDAALQYCLLAGCSHPLYLHACPRLLWVLLANRQSSITKT